MQACAHICVEVDLKKGLPEAIQLTLDNWSYLQQVDYEQLPSNVRHVTNMDISLKTVRRKPRI
jgi:hypothetical protein